MDEKNSDFMTAKEAAAYLRISLPKIYEIIRQKEPLPAHRIGEKLLFCKEELKEWLLAH